MVVFGVDCPTLRLSRSIDIPAAVSVVIDANGHTVVLDGQGLTRHFVVDGGGLTSKGLTLTNGRAVGANGGPGVAGGNGTAGTIGFFGGSGDSGACLVGGDAGGPGTPGSTGGQGISGIAGRAGESGRGGSILIHSGTVVLENVTMNNNRARLSLSKISAALKAAGRQRNIETRAREIQTVLRQEHLTAPPAVAAAFAATTTAAVHVIAELNHQIGELESALAEHFETHPDADIYLSQPGLGVVLGARVLGEFGDDPNRYTTAKCRKNYAGTSPLTVASGRKRAVLARHVRNKRLYDALDQWAFCALTTSPGARAFYDAHRAAGDLHHQALRAPGNRLVGILHGCLRHHTLYDEDKAWAHRTTAAA